MLISFLIRGFSSGSLSPCCSTSSTLGGNKVWCEGRGWNNYPAVFISGDTAVPGTAVYQEEEDHEEDNRLIKTVRPLAAQLVNRPMMMKIPIPSSCTIGCKESGEELELLLGDGAVEVTGIGLERKHFRVSIEDVGLCFTVLPLPILSVSPQWRARWSLSPSQLLGESFPPHRRPGWHSWWAG